jgi:hypothetical protein
MKRVRRLIRIFLLGVLGYLVAWEVILPLLSRMWEKREGPKILAVATESQLQTAVGPLGCVLRFPDGSWLAIRYADSHAMASWSFAAARDSGGMHYESTEHFCGALRAAELVQADTESKPPKIPTVARGEWLHALAMSPDLATARLRLTSRYFHAIP